MLLNGDAEKKPSMSALTWRRVSAMLLRARNGSGAANGSAVARETKGEGAAALWKAAAGARRLQLLHVLQVWTGGILADHEWLVLGLVRCTGR
jgi:hypothetical protein